LFRATPAIGMSPNRGGRPQTEQMGIELSCSRSEMPDSCGRSGIRALARTLLVVFPVEKFGPDQAHHHNPAHCCGGTDCKTRRHFRLRMAQGRGAKPGVRCPSPKRLDKAPGPSFVPFFNTRKRALVLFGARRRRPSVALRRPASKEPSMGSG